MPAFVLCIFSGKAKKLRLRFYDNEERPKRCNVMHTCREAMYYGCQGFTAPHPHYITDLLQVYSSTYLVLIVISCVQYVTRTMGWCIDVARTCLSVTYAPSYFSSASSRHRISHQKVFLGNQMEHESGVSTEIFASFLSGQHVLTRHTFPRRLGFLSNRGWTAGCLTSVS